MVVGGQDHASVALPPENRPGTYCTEDWVGPQGRSGRVRKISSPPGFDPRTVQPVASRYTDPVLSTQNDLCALKEILR
jgi:hypothetical protein